MVRADDGGHGGLEVGGEWIDRPWDLVSKNGDHLHRDFAAADKFGVSNRHLAKLALVGPVDRLGFMRPPGSTRTRFLTR